MSQYDDDPKPALFNNKKNSVPKMNAIRIFHMILFAGMIALLIVFGLEFLLSRFCNDQVVLKSFQVGRVILTLVWVAIWISYEIEKRYQFFSQRIGRD
jgi:hypothetical protein